LQLLQDELEKLRASDILIEASFSSDQIRLDGWPKGGAKPTYPGIVISFNSPGLGRLEYATDSCEDWQHNIRSIALGLEALRAVDRYGITSGRQQYTGFKAIGAGNPAQNGRRGAATWIAKLIAGENAQLVVVLREGLLVGESEVNKKNIRQAQTAAHPDTGGSTEMFKLLQEKLAILGVS
jgi:hypothetical protein